MDGWEVTKNLTLILFKDCLPASPGVQPGDEMNNMNIHYFQHVPFEGLGSIEQWIQAKSASISITKFYEDPTLPQMDGIVLADHLGGPMSANDDERSLAEKQKRISFAEAIGTWEDVLGICLGAQLIASALGVAYFQIGIEKLAGSLLSV